MAVTFVDSRRHGVQQWYNILPYDHHGGGEYDVGPRIVVGRRQGGMTLDSLLDAIIAYHGQHGTPNIVTVVSHGSTDGLGIPLLASVRGRYNTGRWEHLGLLSGNVAPGFRSPGQALLEEGVPEFDGPLSPTPGSPPPAAPAPTTATDAQAADEIFEDLGAGQRRRLEPRITALRAKMRQVQGFHIPTLVLRSCNVGGDDNTMRQIGRFFGVTNVNAPRHRDAFGTTGRIQAMGARLTSPGGSSWATYYDSPQAGRPGRNVLVYLQVQVNESTMVARGRTRDASSVARWMTLTFRAGGRFSPPAGVVSRAISRGTPVHGIWVPPGQSLGGVASAQQYQGGLVFPGMPGYVQSIRTLVV